MKNAFKKFSLGPLFALVLAVAGWAYVDMTPAPTNQSTGSGNKVNAFEISFTTVCTTAGGTTESIIIPSGVTGIAVTVKPQGGTAVKVQTTTDPVYTVKTDTTNTTWMDWADGTVSTNTTDGARAVSAIRMVVVTTGTTGTAVITVRAQ